VLQDLGEMLRWQDEIVAYVRRVMVYPLIVLAVVGGAVGFLMVYLVPKLTSFLQSVGSELPMHTRALIAVSDFFVAWWYVLLLLAFATPAVIRYMSRNSPRFRFAWDGFKLRVWLFGDLMYKIRLARFSKMCGADMPKWIFKRVRAWEEQEDFKSIRQFGEDVITDQCRKLIDLGAPGIHFYTLNRAQASLKLCRNLGLGEGNEAGDTRAA
jgi:hypothetical protein